MFMTGHIIFYYIGGLTFVVIDSHLLGFSRAIISFDGWQKEWELYTITQWSLHFSRIFGFRAHQSVLRGRVEEERPNR